MDTIDVHDLPEEEANLIQELVKRLREKAHPPVAEEEDLEFATRPLGVKGTLTREEIYDYL